MLIVACNPMVVRLTSPGPQRERRGWLGDAQLSAETNMCGNFFPSLAFIFSRTSQL